MKKLTITRGVRSAEKEFVWRILAILLLLLIVSGGAYIASPEAQGRKLITVDWVDCHGIVVHPDDFKPSPPIAGWRIGQTEFGLAPSPSGDYVAFNESWHGRTRLEVRALMGFSLYHLESGTFIHLFTITPMVTIHRPPTC